ncbi:MAG: molybdenum cofactor biosynthesis protein MoaE [Bacteroidales bacterium]|nr:molybdenum cofactor biosynthesis protein MoaE [Bacteroidales bacterium]
MKTTTHLIDGPIPSRLISSEIEKHTSKTNIGAHAIFLGQVRADLIGENKVSGIEYSAYEEMIAITVQEIKDSLFAKYDDLICMHIFHSTGMVKVGENSLFVLVSSRHRKHAFRAIEDCVEQIKEKLPVWKKEIFQDGSHKWQNK